MKFEYSIYNEIKRYLEENNYPSFRFKQIIDGIFKQCSTNFSEVKGLPKKLQEELDSKFKISDMNLIEEEKSGNTIKFLMKTKDGNAIETVLMEHRDGRKTVCLSSQIFCALGCTFCATGANKFARNLTTQEILEQALFVQRSLKKRDERITNIVFMGMGEPFLNYNNVIETVRILNDPNFFNIGARHITVSTSGIVPRIYDYADFELQTRLAISLHAPNDKLRTEIMPINKGYPLKSLMESCDNFVEKTNKRISYEYVLIKNINDSPKHAIQLINLLKDRLAHVNLLIYNPHEFAEYEMPEKETVLRFRDMLKAQNIEVSIRKSMGDDISGACGQLSGKVVRKGFEKEYLSQT